MKIFAMKHKIKTRFIPLILLVFIYTCAVSQTDKDKVLFTINDNEYLKNDFIRTFQNNTSLYTDEKKSVEENLDLYINLKLKVLEGEKLNLDTTQIFKREMNSYRRQLAQSYLVDKEVNEELMYEAYERMKYDIKASHILLRVAADTPAEDTLLVYRKAMKIRNRILSGESFEKVAAETSDEAPARENGGDLGYFTVFNFVYPFENAAYNLPVGNISMPVRSYFGYHIIKVTDKRPARGKIKCARIIVHDLPEASQEEKQQAKLNIFRYHEMLETGEPFEEIARKYSEDERGASRGGVELHWWNVGLGDPIFNQTAFSLEEIGDYSQPVHDGYSWNIIKLVDKLGIQEFSKARKELENGIFKSNERSEKSVNAIVSKLKKEYNFMEDSTRLTEFYRVVDNSIFLGAWPSSRAEGLDKIILSVNNIVYTQQDFALFLEKNMRKSEPLPISEYVDNMYRGFVNECVLKYENSKLEEKYPEFRRLLQEFHDGNLLFELNDNMVWSKAQKDTAGLRNFYNNNKENYIWGSRINASIYTISAKNNTNDVLEAVKKLADRISKRGYTEEEINDRIKTIEEKYPESQIKRSRSIYAKGMNKIIDALEWESGSSGTLNYEGSIAFVYFHNIVESVPKKLNETRGLVTADYQNYLEKEWIGKLREEYDINIDRDVLSKIKF